MNSRKHSRIPIEEIYQKLERELSTGTWNKTTVYTPEQETFRSREFQYPINAYDSIKAGPAFWLIAGIHGNEPAGTNAVVYRLKKINDLANKFPLVLLPLCNPHGYKRNSRYSKPSQDIDKGKSHEIQEADPFIPDKEDKGFTVFRLCPQARKLCEYILRLSTTHPPKVVLNLHEDSKSKQAYVYSWGQNPSLRKTLEQLLIKTLQSRLDIRQDGVTRFNESIQNGVITDSHDGSIDEMLAQKKVYPYKGGEMIQGPNASAVFTLETPSKSHNLSKRIKAYLQIIELIPEIARLSEMSI